MKHKTKQTHKMTPPPNMHTPLTECSTFVFKYARTES